MSQEETFKARPKLARSPPTASDSGFVTNLLNLTDNLQKIDESIDQNPNSVRISKNRRSVSFSLPSSSSTFYVPNNDQEHQEDLLTEHSKTVNQANDTFGELVASTERLIHESNDNHISPTSQILDPNRITQTHYGDTLFNPFDGAEETFSQLKDPDFSLFESSTSVANQTQFQHLSVENLPVNARKTEVDLKALSSPNSIVPNISQSSIIIDQTVIESNTPQNQSNQPTNRNPSENSNQTVEQSNTFRTQPIHSPQNGNDGGNNRDNGDNFGEPADSDDNSVESIEDLMALNISTVLAGIGNFSSKSQEEIKQFIANCDLYYDLAGDDLKPIVLKVIRTRLVSTPKLGNIEQSTWTEIKNRIISAFKPELSFEAAQEKLLQIQQNSNETIDKYGDRIKKLLDAMNTASFNDNVDVQIAQFAANEKLAIRKFKQNLFDQNLRVMSLAISHTSLYDAITFAIEKREELNTSNVKIASPATKPASNTNANAIGKEKTNLFCKICKRRNHDTAECNRNKKKNESDESKEHKDSKNPKSNDKKQSMQSHSDQNECNEQQPDPMEASTSERMELRPFNSNMHLFSIDANEEEKTSNTETAEIFHATSTISNEVSTAERKDQITPNREQSPKAILVESYLEKPKSDLIIKLTVSICNGKITFLVDTGANASMISARQIKSNVLYYPKIQYCLIGISGPKNVVKTIGATYGNVSICDVKLNHQFQIAGEEIHMSYDGILGLDFLSTYQANISIYRMKILFLLPANHELYEHEARKKYETEHARCIEIMSEEKMIKYSRKQNLCAENSQINEKCERETKKFLQINAAHGTLQTVKIDSIKRPDSIHIKANESFDLLITASDTVLCKHKVFKAGVYTCNTIVGEGENVIAIHNDTEETVEIKSNDLCVEYERLEKYNVYTIKNEKTLNGQARVDYIMKHLKTEHCSPEEKSITYDLITQFKDIFHVETDPLSVARDIEHCIHLKPDANPVYTKQYKLPHRKREILDHKIKEMLESGVIESSTSTWNSPLLIVPKKDAVDEFDYRVCVDFKKVNKLTRDLTFPMPDIDDELSKMKGAKVFSKLDLFSAFHQISLREKDKEITAFQTSNRKYQFTRMPFGLKGSPITWQKFITHILSHLFDRGVMVYMDDIMVYSPDVRSHVNLITEILECLRKYNLQLKISKTEFFASELLYLGHIISERGVKPSERNVETVKNFPQPKKLVEVQRFLGMASYFRKFIRDFAKIAKPLNYLCKKDIEFVWTTDCENAFKQLKDALTSSPVLAFPDFQKMFYISVDASFYAVGAYIGNDPPPNDKPIEYFSKTLNPAQINYATTHKELLAIVLAIERFQHYIYGKHFVVHTDHEALTYLFNQHKPGSRLLRWKLLLAENDFDIIHRSGKNNVVSDCLSRIPQAEVRYFHYVNNQVTKSMLQAITRSRAKEKVLIQEQTAENRIKATYHINEEPKATFNDKKFAKIFFIADGLKYLAFKKLEMKIKNKIQLNNESFYEIYEVTKIFSVILIPKVRFEISKMSNTIVHVLRIATESRAEDIAINMCIENFKTHMSIKSEYKLVFKTSEINTTFCICKLIEIESIEDINEILHTYHSSILGAHRGFTRMKNTIQQYYSWPTMSSDIRRYIEKCDICEKTKITRHTQTPLQITSVANFPFEKIYVDFVGEINPNSQENHKHVMTISCDLTKFALCIPTFDCTAITAARTIVENVCLVYNIPKIIVSDNGPAFISETFMQMLKLLGISHVKITPSHAQSNAVERYHRTLGQYVRAYTEGNRDYWHKCIPFFVSSYNNTVHSATGYSPHSLVFGFDVEIPTNIKNSRPNYNYESYTQELQWQ